MASSYSQRTENRQIWVTKQSLFKAMKDIWVKNLKFSLSSKGHHLYRLIRVDAQPHPRLQISSADAYRTNNETIHPKTRWPIYLKSKYQALKISLTTSFPPVADNRQLSSLNNLSAQHLYVECQQKFSSFLEVCNSQSPPGRK